jgi:uncharacterized SAM-binding protein YcdF (DUF218 family)
MPDKPTGWKRLRRIAMRSALVISLPAAALFAWVASGAVVDDAHADCIFVPGAAVRPGRKPSNALQYRLDRALELYRDGRAPLIVVAGGGEGDYAEAEIMAEWLSQQGVPAAAIIKETNSGSTRENTRFSAPMMRKAGIRSAIVCTQWFHARRASLCLTQEGFEANPVRCGGNTLIREPYFVCREMAALPLHALRLDPGA